MSNGIKRQDMNTEEIRKEETTVNDEHEEDSEIGSAAEDGSIAGDKTERRKKRRPGFAAGIVTGLVLAVAAFTLYRGYIYFPFGKAGELLIKFPYYEALHGNTDTGSLDRVEVNRKLMEINDLVSRNYLYAENPEKISDGIFAGYIYGMTDDDSYAAYYSASSYANEKKSLNGSYVGIGVSCSKDEETGGVLIAAVTEGGPADEAGLLTDDIIIEADGNDLTGLELDDCIALITGDEGTDVQLKVMRGEETFEVTVTRATVKEISVRYEVIPKTNIGYLSVSRFTPTTEQDFYAAMDDLGQDKQVDGIVIDLRNNSGGDMNVALRMLDTVLSDDLGENGGRTLLLSVEDKNGDIESYYAEDGISDSIPINVLVNAHSASASEIFAGTLKCYGYDIIGSKTFGKGIVQSIYSLNDNSAVKFTTDYYLLPDGSRIHGEGIEPTIAVEFEDYDDVNADMVNYSDSSRKPDYDRDVQLRTAIDTLMEQIYS